MGSPEFDGRPEGWGRSADRTGGVRIADKTRRVELATSQRNKVSQTAALVAPENLGELKVSFGPRLRGLLRLLVEMVVEG